MSAHGPWIAPGLARLGLLRVAPRGVVLAALALALFAATRDPGPPAELPLEARATAELVRGLARQGVFGLLAAFLAPLLVYLAADQPRRWREGEADWLAPRAPSRTCVLASTWLGASAAAGALLLGAALFAELAARGAGPGLRSAGELAAPALRLPAGQRAPAFRLDERAARAPGGARVLARLCSDHSADAALTLSSAGVALDVARRRIAWRGELWVALPPAGAAGLELSLANEGEDGVVTLLPGGLELLVPAASERLASLELFLRAWAALAAALALALGGATWVSPATATLGVLALWVPAWMGVGPLLALPGADLPEALSQVGFGRVPSAFAPASLLGLVASVASGLALGVRGLAHWRGR